MTLFPFNSFFLKKNGCVVMRYFRWGTADSPSLSKAVSESVESEIACAMLWAYSIKCHILLWWCGRVGSVVSFALALVHRWCAKKVVRFDKSIRKTCRIESYESMTTVVRLIIAPFSELRSEGQRWKGLIHAV
ncbi:hypothetical protein HQ35_07900 [Porphyromonas cangingivalis]|uniref:Uncharacterized protein n=1 Tax=Porphyromonas cangingivalis TaxID=36874 RepID=A0A0A2ET06_PORCN|nr:hypothetical protein HQ35_07900 [Porphyromonas cangingivalis]